VTLRLGVVGGGLIAQAIHLPNLARLGHLFELRALADPSDRVRTAVAARYGIRPYADWRGMVGSEELDALVVCSPHATHAEVVLAALDAGLHVFVEKPLCIDPADAERIDAACAESSRVVQIGYMKRFDAAYEELVSDLPALDGLRYVDVITYDPWMAREPFVDAHVLVPADDLPAAERERVGRLQLEQVEAAVGSATPHEAWVFAHTYLACLIHDVNLVHGVLEAAGEPLPARSCTSSAWASGNAAAGTFELANGALWSCAWMLLPNVDEFRETATWYFDDAVLTLEFPAPYLRAAPTRLVRRRRDGDRYGTEDRHVYGSSYVRELEHFHDCVTAGDLCRTPPEQGRTDIVALRDLFVTARERRRIGAVAGA
jgi:predicted dehydrogenase